MKSLLNQYLLLLALPFVLSLCSIQTLANEKFELNTRSIFSEVTKDYATFYQTERMYRVASVFAVGALIANTSVDSELHDWHTSTIKSDFSNDISSFAKLFGEKSLMVPLALAGTAMQMSSTNNVFGEWGQLTFRSYLVGSPAVGALQLLTGGARPRDFNDSTWRPFNDDNGVSGHAYVGAVPFLVLAKMKQLTPMQKNIALFASGLSAWSRVNDNAHYTSQALLGWYMAWEAVDAVTSNGVTENWMKVSPYTFGDGVGVSVVMTW